MDQKGNGHNKLLKFQKPWAGGSFSSLFQFNISLPNFRIPLQKSHSLCKKNTSSY